MSGPERAVDEKRICPECSLKMKTFNYAYNSNIFLDRCFECGNVWIDAEEFSTLISYTKGNPKIDNLTRAVSDHEAESIAEKDAIENMKGMTRGSYFGRYALFDYISRKLQSNRTPFLTKIWWIIIILVLIFLYSFFRIQH